MKPLIAIVGLVVLVGLVFVALQAAGNKAGWVTCPDGALVEKQEYCIYHGSNYSANASLAKYCGENQQCYLDLLVKCEPAVLNKTTLVNVTSNETGVLVNKSLWLGDFQEVKGGTLVNCRVYSYLYYVTNQTRFKEQTCLAPVQNGSQGVGQYISNKCTQCTGPYINDVC